MIEGTCNLDWMRPDEQGQIEIELIRKWAKSLEVSLRETLYPSRESSLALTKLEECVMWATKSVCIRTKE